MRIATFNVQNLRLRGKDGEERLDGAWDHDDPLQPDPALDRMDRKLTAQVLRRMNADVVALQEVFDQKTLDHFHDHFLAKPGYAPYPVRKCLPGNDGRGLNVAVMSRDTPLRVITHAHETDETLGLTNIPPGMTGRRIFRRDCLEVVFRRLTLFVCHFKAPYPDVERARAIRDLEARALRKIIETRFQHPEREAWLILGDLNEPAPTSESSALRDLTEGFAVDLMSRVADDWTYIEPDHNEHVRPDGILASPHLAQRFPDTVPEIIRAGLSPETARAAARRLADVNTPRPHASDHAAICVDFPGI